MDNPPTDAIEKLIEFADGFTDPRRDAEIIATVAAAYKELTALTDRDRQREAECAAIKDQIRQAMIHIDRCELNVAGRILIAALSTQAGADLLARLSALEAENKRIREDAASVEEEEQGRWQQRIYERLCDLTKALPDVNIDGKGCDSGDPLDFTVSEIEQGIGAWIDHAAELETRLAMAEDAANKGEAGRNMGTAYEQVCQELAAIQAGIDNEFNDEKSSKSDDLLDNFAEFVRHHKEVEAERNQSRARLSALEAELTAERVRATKDRHDWINHVHELRNVIMAWQTYDQMGVATAEDRKAVHDQSNAALARDQKEGHDSA